MVLMLTSKTAPVCVRLTSLAQDTERTREERGRNGLYREMTEAGKLRKEIVNVLKKPVAERITHRRDTYFEKFGKTDYPRAISHLTPIATIEVQELSKTVACLDRESQLPSTYAFSGWTHPSETAIRLLEGAKWTEKVMKLAQLLNYGLPSSEQANRTTPGKFCACHAEKQLMTFFLPRHVIFESEIGPCLEEHSS
jgi:hypothetical protein